jgi:aryl-alcohol dehydrogenase-like predicted oxidoreductase
VALRFCLTSRDVATVIVGVRTAEELAEALGSAAAGPLSPDEMAVISVHSITDDSLLNPAKWSGV